MYMQIVDSWGQPLQLAIAGTDPNGTSLRRIPKTARHSLALQKGHFARLWRARLWRAGLKLVPFGTDPMCDFGHIAIHLEFVL